ncbi:CBF-domain-containing protein [Clavulina sp. PMI_390]|nr:CBF-domain-containing protein [Clavulina sp. PMI_390]
MAPPIEKSRRPIKPLKASKSSKISPKTAPGPSTSSPKGHAKKAPKSQASSAVDPSVDELRSAIRALGGEDDDYELVKDLDGDEGDEIQEFSDQEANAKTTKEIASFLKKLNFKSQDAIVSDVESDAESEVDEIPTKTKKENESQQQQQKADKATKTAPLEPSEESKAVRKQLAAVRLNIPASTRWYATEFPTLSPLPSLPAPSQSELNTLRAKAQSLHAALPAPETTSKSDEQFIANVLASGTLSDRLSALTLMAQSSPIHNTRALEQLRTMAGKKGREESLKALRAIVDWWVGGGGPDRKLKYLADQPVNHPDVTDTQLTVWWFEDWLKKYFFNILQLLETLTQDLLPYVRTQAMTLIFQLLNGKPEQEQNLLRLLVNKLGDSEKNVASKASYQLLQILQHHPGMKSIIVREIASLIFRPPTKSASTSTATSPDGVNVHARYYGVITLNQVMLSPSEADQAVALQLVDLYFKLFQELLHESGRSPKNPSSTEAQTKPDVKAKGKKGAANAKGKGKAPETQATDGFTEVEDSDSKTISAILSGVNRAMPFAKPDDATFENHIDTLFRITHTATFNVSVQALMLILQVTSSKQSISDRFYRTLYESILDPRLVNSSKQAMWLNLTFKAVKADKTFSRIAAFVKRILQGLNMHQPPFICGTLYMIGQLMETTPSLKELMHVPRRVNQSGKPKAGEDIELSEAYDARKRDPQYAHAESTCLWELVPLLHHFHPSVSLHASQILTSAQVTATPDLALNTLSHFLDRFVYKNPKQPKPRGASAMQPAASAHDGSGSVHLVKGGISGDGGVKSGTVNDEGFWKMKASQVPVDQLFFHKFFLNKIEKQNEKSKKIAKRKKGEDDESEDDSDNSAAASEDESEDAVEAEAAEQSDAESENSDDSEEAEIWRVMQETMPGPKADLDLMEDDSDSIPSGLSDLDDSEGDDSDSDSEALGVSGDEAEPDEDEEDEGIDVAEGVVDDEDEDEDAVPQNDDSSSDDEPVDFAEDEDDLVSLNSEVLIPSAFEPEDSEAVTGKRKPHEDDTRKGGRKKRKLGALPTFASYEDYAKLIEDAPEEDL